MRITIVTDAWNQLNGVVTTLQATVDCLRQRGDEVQLIVPDDYTTFPLPGYPEIRVPLWVNDITKRIWEFNPDSIHIATEGRLGWAARRVCVRHGWNFTTAYHTDFPRFLKHFGIPASLTMGVLRRFHSKSSAVMVSTKTIANELECNGFSNITTWGRGVDQTVFFPDTNRQWDTVFLNVGRVSKEKNLEAFMSLKLPGRKVVVGDGPMLETYRLQFPDVEFMGALRGKELGDQYRSAACFVFPSRSDTFGLVLAEAISCGTPVAAYPVQGPLDVVPTQAGVLNDDLAMACNIAMHMNRKEVAEAGRVFSWEGATDQFRNALVDIR